MNNVNVIKKFSTYDGMAFKLLQKTGIKVGILTTEDRELNRRRSKKLGLDFDFISANTTGATPFFNRKISDLRPAEVNSFLTNFAQSSIPSFFADTLGC